MFFILRRCGHKMAHTLVMQMKTNWSSILSGPRELKSIIWNTASGCLDQSAFPLEFILYMFCKLDIHTS